MPKKNTSVFDTTTPEHDDVGYGKPPRRTRFKKGQSGNPTGRRTGTKNLKTDIAEELQESVTVREGERSTKISKQRAIVKTLVNRTHKGDAAAARNLLGAMNKLFDQQDSMEELDAPLDADDIEVLEAVEKRLLARAAAAAGAAPFPATPSSEGSAGPADDGADHDHDHDDDEQSE